MKFETVLFAAAFLILAMISVPENSEDAGAETDTVSAYSIGFSDPVLDERPEDAADEEDVPAQRPEQSS